MIRFETSSLSVTVDRTGLYLVWPLCRSRPLGIEIFNHGPGLLLRFRNLQISGGFAIQLSSTFPTRRYLYIADRQLREVRWLVGGPKGV